MMIGVSGDECSAGVSSKVFSMGVSCEGVCVGVTSVIGVVMADLGDGGRAAGRSCGRLCGATIWGNTIHLESIGKKSGEHKNNEK